MVARMHVLALLGVGVAVLVGFVAPAGEIDLVSKEEIFLLMKCIS